MALFLVQFIYLLFSLSLFAGEDSNFNDIPSLVEHKKRLLDSGKEYTERDKAEFFIGMCACMLSCVYVL